MIISTEQIKRRLAILNVRVGDVSFCLEAPGHVEIYARADNHQPSVFVAFRPTDFERLIEDANHHFQAAPPNNGHILEDGRKIPS